MAEAKLDFMEADAFLAWCTRQEARYELVDGLPRLMAGAKQRHDRIVVNALATLRPLLRKGPCFPHSADFAVKIPNGNIRRPDVLVDCGPTASEDLAAKGPTFVLEVLSPSTRQFDLVRKVIEYQTVASIKHILLVEPDEMAALLHSREPDGSWSALTFVGPGAEIALPALGITLPLSDLYE